MQIQGDAPWVLGVCWMLTALVLVFVLLRIYTRVFIVDSFGYDDSAYIVAYVCPAPKKKYHVEICASS